MDKASPFWFLPVLVGVGVGAVRADAPRTTTSGSYTVVQDNQPVVPGSGRSKTEARPVGGFNAVRLEGAINVRVRHGDKPAAAVTIDDNLQNNIKLTVRNNTLIISSVGSFSTKLATLADITIASVQAVELMGAGDITVEDPGTASQTMRVALSGSGDISLNKLALARLDVTLGGSGSITAVGRADAFTFAIDGSGEIIASKLTAKRVKASIDGSGDAAVFAKDAIDVNIGGSGSVNVAGKPAVVNKQIDGSGDVNVL